MGSTRLPGKVLMDIGGKPLLEHVVERIAQAKLNLPLLVCTSTNQEDKKIKDFCDALNINCFQGCLLDVASRFEEISKIYQLNSFIRISGDSPLIDPNIINNFFTKWDLKYDILTNVFPRSYPSGQSVEIVNANTFKLNVSNFKSPEEREHVTRYFYLRNKQFKIKNLKHEDDLSNCCLAVDTKADFQKISKLLKKTGPSWKYLGFKELLSIYNSLN